MIKHTFKQTAAAFFAAFLCIGMVSCDGTEGGGNDGNDDPAQTPTQPQEPSQEEAMSPLEQKQYLESAAIEFLNAIPAAEQMEELANKIKELGELEFDDYDNEPLAEWWEDAYKSCLTAVGAPTTETEEYWRDWGYGQYHYIYNYICQNYNGLFVASNFMGHFTGSASTGEWKIEKANDLQFLVNDFDGTKWVLKLTTGGAVKKVHVAEYEDDWLGDVLDETMAPWDPDKTEFEYHEYYSRINATIGVPENIEVSLSRNGEVLAKTSLTIDLDSLNGEEFDLGKSNFSVKVSTELGSRIKVEVNKVAYNGNNSVSASAIVLVDNKPVLTLGASTAISGLPSVNASAFATEYEDLDYDDANAKNVYVKLDIMSKVQFQGTLTDARKFYDYMDMAYENDQNETNFKSYIGQANALFDINIFYNESAVKQAAVKLEPFEESDWWDERYWDVEPVLHFFDGTSYSTFEAFFNDRDFKETIKTFERLLEDYMEMLGIDDEWGDIEAGPAYGNGQGYDYPDR